MKNFSYYFKGEFNFICTSNVGIAFSNLLFQEVTIVSMDEEEFRMFFDFFSSQIPNDWDGKTFKGVKINKIK